MKKTHLTAAAKAALLARPLANFGIRPLTLWIARSARQHQGSVEIAGAHGHFHGRDILHVETVGQLIDKYHYRFPAERGCSIGSKPADELKKELLRLGLTPDDWPALAPHNKLLQYLSKESLLRLPLTELLGQRRSRDHDLRYYLGIGTGVENLMGITVWELVKIHPLKAPETARYFVRNHRRLLIGLRQELAKKGATTRDGALMEWDPNRLSLQKAMRRLAKYELRPATLRQFAQIAVNERWVI